MGISVFLALDSSLVGTHYDPRNWPSYFTQMVQRQHWQEDYFKRLKRRAMLSHFWADINNLKNEARPWARIRLGPCYCPPVPHQHGSPSSALFSVRGELESRQPFRWWHLLRIWVHCLVSLDRLHFGVKGIWIHFLLLLLILVNADELFNFSFSLFINIIDTISFSSWHCCGN